MTEETDIRVYLERREENDSESQGEGRNGFKINSGEKIKAKAQKES